MEGDERVGLGSNTHGKGRGGKRVSARGRDGAIAQREGWHPEMFWRASAPACEERQHWPRPERRPGRRGGAGTERARSRRRGPRHRRSWRPPRARRAARRRSPCSGCCACGLRWTYRQRCIGGRESGKREISGKPRWWYRRETGGGVVVEGKERVGCRAPLLVARGREAQRRGRPRGERGERGGLRVADALGQKCTRRRDGRKGVGEEQEG